LLYGLRSAGLFGRFGGLRQNQKEKGRRVMDCTPIVRHTLTVRGAVFFMTKFTKDKKLEIIQGYDPDLLSQTEYANQMGVTKSHFPKRLEIATGVTYTAAMVFKEEYP
jgi:hypothetical protein